MLIAQLGVATDERSGDWFYRTEGPGRALAELPDVWVVDAAHIHRARQTLLTEADVLVINMVPDIDLRPVINDRRKQGRVTVFEMNDDVAHPRQTTGHARYLDPYEITKLKQMLGACDAVQFSTPYLARKYGRYARRSCVFLNQMPARKHQRPVRGDGKLVIGWGGSFGHLEDLRRVAPALVPWLNGRSGVELAIMADPRLYEVFRELAPGKRRHVPLGDIDDYYRFLCGVDIGFAPLDGSDEFNHSRSDVKFLEMALHGVAPVLQDLAPYRDTVREGETSLFFRDPAGLVAALARLCDDREARQGLAARAQAYVERERLMAQAAAERMELYLSLLPASGGAARTARAQAVCAGLAHFDGATGSGRHLWLRFGEYEKLVWKGLALAMVGRMDEALESLAEASRREPTAYQPHHFSAMFAPKTQKRAHLVRALAREPRSLLSLIDLGDELDDLGNVTEAFRLYTAAAEVDPGYDQAYAKTSLLLTRLGRAAEAREFGAVAARIQQPFLV